MDDRTREQRRRETCVRLVQSHADTATSLLARAPGVAANVQYPDIVRTIMADSGAASSVIQKS